MNLFEFELKQRGFVSELINKMPEIAKTMNTLLEIKHKRKIMKQLNQWHPDEGIEDPNEMQEPDTSLGATEQSI